MWWNMQKRLLRVLEYQKYERAQGVQRKNVKIKCWDSGLQNPRALKFCCWENDGMRVSINSGLNGKKVSPLSLSHFRFKDSPSFFMSVRFCSAFDFSLSTSSISFLNCFCDSFISSMSVRIPRSVVLTYVSKSSSVSLAFLFLEAFWKLLRSFKIHDPPPSWSV